MEEKNNEKVPQYYYSVKEIENRIATPHFAPSGRRTGTNFDLMYDV